MVERLHVAAVQNSLDGQLWREGEHLYSSCGRKSVGSKEMSGCHCEMHGCHCACHRSLVRQFSSGDTVPPSLLM